MSEPLARLPELTRAEMTELAEALSARLRVLDAFRKGAFRPEHVARLDERIAVCRSLSVAVVEASYHMRRQA